jgi:hypothetical protein
VQQVANEASQQVYKANQDVTQKYQYLATLDSRTSAICRSLDGKTFKYGDGPTPPVHFNCRSTTIPVIDYRALGLRPPEEVIGPARRASEGGQVSADTNYAQWLRDRPEVQREIFGSKQPYYTMLLEKYGPEGALSRFVREDGSEVSLKQLQQRYGKPEP